MNKIPLFFLLSIILLASHLQPASAGAMDDYPNFSIKLAINPSHVEEGILNHDIGYVYVLNKDKIPVTLSEDIQINLASDNPELASVPESIILKEGNEYGKFLITTGKLKGETFITASFNSKTSFQKFTVGVSQEHIPDDVILELNLPTDEMHVNSEMPISIFLKTANGIIVRAPFDLKVSLDFEKSLLTLEDSELTIKKGEYYAWTTIQTNQKIGNAFLRASQVDYGLDIAKSIKISSTLPAGLQVDIFPKLVPIEVNRNVDVFVSVVDSEGNPTITPKDIPLNFFSNNQNLIGEKLEESVRTLKPVIKKGQFGYHLKADLNLTPLKESLIKSQNKSTKNNSQDNTLRHLIPNNMEIGASAEGLGVASGTFSIVGKSINIENPKIKEKGLQLFVPARIPSNATAIATYQLITIEDDDDDPEIEGQQTIDIENKPIMTLDDLEEGDFYPLQANEIYYGTGYVKKLDVISDNKKLVYIKDVGRIESSYSFGSAIIASGHKSGPVLISASVQGVGSASEYTEVVNTLEQKEVRIFSPTGENNILFDREGNFDIFLISIDAENRPKVMKNDSKYLITPTNGIAEIKKNKTFSFSKLYSDSFATTNKESNIILKVVPIGENTDLSVQSEKSFFTQPSSKLQIMSAVDTLNAKFQDNFGVIQITDLQNNPIILSSEVKTKFSSTDKDVVILTPGIMIPSGLSYSSFPIQTTGIEGKSVLSVSAKGVIGSNMTINTDGLATKLKISTGGLAQKISPNEEIEIKLYVDNENADSVIGSLVRIQTDGNSFADPTELRTNQDGSAIFKLTASKGQDTTVNLLATASGYSDATQTLTIQIDSPEKPTMFGSMDFPEWIVYVVVGSIVVMAILLFLFLKKSKNKVVEDWDEEEI